MLGRIKEILDNKVYIKLEIDITQQENLVNLHVVFENNNAKIVGEIVNTNMEEMIVNIVGEIVGNTFLPGVSKKPSFKSNVRMINFNELELILGSQTPSADYINLGMSNIYNNYHVNVDVNSFFSNHFAVLGNSGSGKSFTVASLLQHVFTSFTTAPLGANIFLFDAYGEYTNAFSKLKEVNPNIKYKVYTTDIKYNILDIIRIPVWLLDVDDLALLLDVTTPNQLPIIEKALKLVPILTGETEEVIKHKNDIIARAILDILLSGIDSTKIIDQTTAVLTKFHTKDLNLETTIVQPGYVRTFKQCLILDKTGKILEMELIVKFIKSFITDNNEEIVFTKNYRYSLEDLEMAMDFALISEGILKSEKVFDFANVLSVRLHSLVNSDAKLYFSYDEDVTREEYILRLLTDNATKTKCQIVNFNISYIDDRLAKVMTKILSKMLFTQAISNQNRGSIPFHIIIEEAHRYVQNDKDNEILGYNIFERITKEGRKYGVLLGLITQRPSELSDTAISQCSNFIILRTLHPKDLDYIKNMVPNITSEIVIQLKNLKPGNCIAFGSAFRIPLSMYVEKPNPEPLSNNVDIKRIWFSQK